MKKSKYIRGKKSNMPQIGLLWSFLNCTISISKISKRKQFWLNYGRTHRKQNIHNNNKQGINNIKHIHTYQ